MLKIYTKTGDAGQTSIIGGRVCKDDARVEAYGTIDELNSMVGYAASLLEGASDDLKSDLWRIQHELFDCGGDLAIARKKEQRWKVKADMIDWLEGRIDHYDAQISEITRFILPGGSTVSAVLHICRTVCRRAERRAVALGREQEMNPQVLRYLNRLSDFFFTAARTANARAGVGDVDYVRSPEVFGKSR